MMLQKTICAFGYFDLEGARSWVIRKGLTEAGFTVSLCRTEKEGFFPKIADLKRKWRECASSADAMYVVFPGHYLMPLAWRLTRRKKIPVILDAFLSLYDTEVNDRRRVAKWNPKAWFLFFIDWLACALADVILIDTEEQKQYFVRRFHARPEKILVIPVGSRTDLFGLSNEPRPERPWTVRFYGSFIPLHGIETILGAAKELENTDIRFEILGRGQTYPAMRALAERLKLTNVEFLDPVPLADLPAFIRGADVCLGIFGTSGKALRVIPTKAYDILCCGVPLITERSPAAERILRDREHALLTEPGNAHALAEAIRELQHNTSLAGHIASHGRALFEERFQPKMVTEPLVGWVRKFRQ